VLFQIIHKHTVDRCYSAAGYGSSRFMDTIAKLFSKKFHNDTGVTIVNAVIDGPGHCMYMIVETDDHQKLTHFIEPIHDAENEVVPVSDMMYLMSLKD